MPLPPRFEPSTLSGLNTLSGPISLEGRRVFLTGGTGFVGRSLLDYFAESAAQHAASFEVVVLSRLPEAFLARFPAYADQPWLRFVAGDLDTLPDIGGFTDLIHAAADTHRGGDRIAWFNQLVDGTRKTLDYAVLVGAIRTLFVSSGAVYGGAGGNFPIEADAAHAPPLGETTTVYGQGKRAAEHLCALYNEQHAIGCVIARCFAIISPHMPLDGPYAAGNFIRDALSNECPAIDIAGNPETLRSYIDGRDMAHWLCALLSYGVAGEAYNVGSDEAVSIAGLARTICTTLSIDKPIRVDPAGPTRPLSVYVPAIDKALALGLRVETGLDEAIRRAAAKRC
ncbi:NAD(P)-dependent oxidoreductase [Sphingomonas sp. PvP018]|jgi:nucleoside-diphosphate-sugar epimerase|uniref:NAD-dependent epimerase/dehydratase family protein n=1 Tax=Sphingomonas sp. PvP018 TaxID=2817852 RepID=UPI001AE8F4BB|nr:NAD(P)-dependent oxidoreductase [Sphingomonas sp. PvP018]MBP2513739.1 nucleoside-diphosphate-sugar epimerase [Sphingomonas sp. PvP018]